MNHSESLPFNSVRYLGEDTALRQQLFATLAEVAPGLGKSPEGEQGRVLCPDHEAVLFFDERGAKLAEAVEVQLAHLRQMFAAVVKIFEAPKGRVIALDRRNCDAVLDATLATNKAALSAVLQEISLRKEGRFESVEVEKRLYVQRHFADKYLALIPGWIEVLSNITHVDESDAESIRSILGGLRTIQGLLVTIKENGFDGGLMHDLGNAFVMFSFMDFVTAAHTGDDLIILRAFQAALDEFKDYRSAIADARTGKTSWLAVACGGFNGSEKMTIEKLFESGAMEIFRGLRICLIDDNEEVLQSTQSVLARAGAKVFSYNPRHEAFAAGFDSAMDGGFEPESAPGLVLLDNDLGVNSLGEREFGHQLIAKLRARFPRALILGHSADALALNGTSDNAYKKSGVAVVNKMDFAVIAEAVKNQKTPGGET